MPINIKDILEQEVNRELDLLTSINDQTTLDDQSKEQIRQRTYNEYQHLHYLLELELA